ncbi:MAG: hypothetical protein NVSMB51_07880 [Solirubrobacteraceae bacterium]
MSNQPIWLAEPQKHDLQAAENFLSLELHAKHVAIAVELLRKRRGKTREFAAKDLLRAADLTPLPAENEGVAAKLKKIDANERISPVLLVRRKRGRLLVADGYHRISAAHICDESTMVPCVLASIS